MFGCPLCSVSRATQQHSNKGNKRQIEMMEITTQQQLRLQQAYFCVERPSSHDQSILVRVPTISQGKFTMANYHGYIEKKGKKDHDISYARSYDFWFPKMAKLIMMLQLTGTGNHMRYWNVCGVYVVFLTCHLLESSQNGWILSINICI